MGSNQRQITYTGYENMRRNDAEETQSTAKLTGNANRNRVFVRQGETSH